MALGEAISHVEDPATVDVEALIDRCQVISDDYRARASAMIQAAGVTVTYDADLIKQVKADLEDAASTPVAGMSM